MIRLFIAPSGKQISIPVDLVTTKAFHLCECGRLARKANPDYILLYIVYRKKKDSYSFLYKSIGALIFHLIRNQLFWWRFSGMGGLLLYRKGLEQPRLNNKESITNAHMKCKKLELGMEWIGLEVLCYAVCFVILMRWNCFTFHWVHFPLML